MDASVLLDRLDGVINRGAGAWYARCPAHDDKSPSLSIRDAGQKILIHCFAGCSVESVLDAMGLSFSDLYCDGWKAARESAISGAAGHYAKKPKADLEHERLILEIAQADIAACKELSLEDQARVQLAVLRLKETA